MSIVFRRGALAAALLVTAAGAAPSTAAAAPAKSTYTRHDFSRCPEAKSPEPGVIEIRRCAGPRGVAVTLTSEPDAALITFGARPVSEALGLGSFHQPGDTIEWRGQTAIVRYRFGDSVGALIRSVLVVHRIEPSGRSCVMAVVREPGANGKARAVADEAGPGFRCGSSARIER